MKTPQDPFDRLRPRVIRVEHLTAGTPGGASAATLRIAESVEPYVGSSSVIEPTHQDRYMATWPRWLALHVQRSSNPVHRSVNITGSKVWADSDLTAPDVAHLHWVGDELLSVRQIGDLARRVPVVWTMHDTWAFTGADHHPKDETDTRYRVGYTKQSRLPGDGHMDVDAWVFRRKMRAWKSPMWLVAPSSHIMKMAQESMLASSWPVTVIPNPVECDVFTPASSQERVDLRRRLGVHGDEPVILFGSGSRASYTKGMDLLAAALAKLRARIPGARFITFGPESDELPEWVHQIGVIENEASLRDVYAAADVLLVPSRFETFSQVAAEAQACGTPVAAFATSGLLDVVGHGETGFLAHDFDPVALADAAEQVLAAGVPMRTVTRERAERLWAMPVVGKKYADWYQQAIAEFQDRQHI